MTTTTTNPFPTPQQLADMLRACCNIKCAEVSAEEYGDKMFWIAVSIYNAGSCGTGFFSYYNGFWYNYSDPAIGFKYVARRFAEVVEDAWQRYLLS